MERSTVKIMTHCPLDNRYKKKPHRYTSQKEISSQKERRHYPQVKSISPHSPVYYLIVRVFTLDLRKNFDAGNASANNIVV